MKVVVVGAGFAGACAALTLREQLGCDVTVLEQHAQPGGMLRTLQTDEGVPYEYGPRVVSVFRGTEDILPFLRRFLKLEERQIYQGTRLRPDYPVVPFPLDLESVRDLPCGRRDRAGARGETRRRGGTSRREPQGVPRVVAGADADARSHSRGSTGSSGAAGWTRCRRSGASCAASSGSPRSASSACRAVSPHYYPVGGFNPLFEQMLAEIDVRFETPVRAVEGNGRPGRS